jgi:ubiquinone/menaquinone biosynthesis C-methylase UbiE
LKRNDISLNFSPRARPDVQGDIARAPFADAVFREVYFEFVPYAAFSGRNAPAITESARVLKPGGRLVIHTGSGVNVADLKIAMRAACFKYIRVTNKGYIHLTARLTG